MKYLFDQAFQIAMMVVFLAVFLLLILIGFMVANKVNRKNRKEADMFYQNLDRFDAQDFLEFEDIVDEMVVMNKHRRFVAAIRCSGYDLYSASPAQRVATFQGYLAFINTITRPITYRQYFVPTSMEHTKNRYASRYESVQNELYHKNADREVLIKRLNTVKGLDLMEEEALLAEIEKLQSDMGNLEWRCRHLKEQMEFIDTICDKNALEPSIEEAYLVSWEYIPEEYSMEMTEEEIHKQALRELASLCNGMIATLGGCNVHAYRCSTEELMEMFYQHTHPLSVMEFKMPAIANSSYFDEFVTTENLSRLRMEAYQDVMMEEGARVVDGILDLAEDSSILKMDEKGEESV